MSTDLADVLTLDRVIIDLISSLSVMYFLYGFYVLLFGTCISMMTSRHRKQGQEGRNHTLYLSLMVALFGLSSILVIAYTAERVHASAIFYSALATGDATLLENYLDHDTQKTVTYAFLVLVPIILKYALFSPTLSFEIVNMLTGLRYFSVTAESMLIHRCYLIWNAKKRVAVPLLVWSAVTNTAGLVGASMVIVNKSDSSTSGHQRLFDLGDIIGFSYSISSLVLNTVLTLLTAGRIWWIYRGLEAYGVHTSDVLARIPRIILESGVLYPLVAIVGTVVINVRLTFIPFDFAPTAALAAGIAPTLIVVRAKLGKSVESMQQQVSEMRFPSRPANREGNVNSQTYSIGNLHILQVDADADEERIQKQKGTTLV
ncbi:hypothetical protein WG66_008296 [Moniliophthora roreri]|uniref:Uncharacterized protein n=1 Tax=Moniliophthora roreri TaxID=221103 RepID=A0A0W0G6C9_MONRR|nr:hypothetical protein WG66_008296 [Moniliophthora roreri]